MEKQSFWNRCRDVTRRRNYKSCPGIRRKVTPPKLVTLKWWSTQALVGTVLQIVCYELQPWSHIFIWASQNSCPPKQHPQFPAQPASLTHYKHKDGTEKPIIVKPTLVTRFPNGCDRAAHAWYVVHSSFVLGRTTRARPDRIRTLS